MGKEREIKRKREERGREREREREREERERERRVRETPSNLGKIKLILNFVSLYVRERVIKRFALDTNLHSIDGIFHQSFICFALPIHL